MEQKENGKDEKERTRPSVEEGVSGEEIFEEKDISAHPPEKEVASAKSSGGGLSSSSHKLLVSLLVAVLVLLVAVTVLSAILVARTGREPRRPEADLGLRGRPLLERRERMLERREEILDRFEDLKEMFGVRELTGNVVSLEEGAITLRTDSGEVRLRITDKTRYAMMGRLKKSRDLSKLRIEEGDLVRVLAREAEDGQLEALLVRASAKD